MYGIGKVYHLWIVLACLLLGCATPSSSEKIVVTGSLLSTTGDPLESGHLVVEVGRVDTSFVVMADEDGTFSFSLAEAGGYGVYALGYHHETLTFPLILKAQESVALDIRLPALSYVADPDSLWITSPSFETDKQAMEKQPDGTFSAVVSVETDTLAYQIFGFTKPNYGARYDAAGMEYDYLHFNDNGPYWDRKDDYFSVLKLKGQPVEITADPKQMIMGDTTYAIKSSPAYVAEIVNIHLVMEQKRRLIGLEYEDLATKYDVHNPDERIAFQEAFNAYSKELRGAALGDFQHEDDPLSNGGMCSDILTG